VWLLRVVLGVAVWLRGARHGRRLLDVVGVNGLHAGDGLVGRHIEREKVRGVGWWWRRTSRSRYELRSSSDVSLKLQLRREASPRSSE
jgi:hypothetical protein